MTEIFELLESEGIVGDQDSLKPHEFSKKRLENLYKRLHEVVLKSQYPDIAPDPIYDPFSYTASASMRGDSSCWELPCRLQKLDFLNNFAALYANKVNVPLLLSNPNTKDSSSDHDRTVLSLSLLTLLRARPLIEAGIVRPTVLQTVHCEHDRELVSGLVEAATRYSTQLAKSYSDDFEAIYQRPDMSPTGKSTIYLSGPADFLEHDMVQLFDEGSKWRLKSWKFDKEGKVRLTGSRKLRSIETIFETISENTTFFLSYGLNYRSRFLSDLPGEILMLGEPEDVDRHVSANAFRNLSHSLPLLANLDLATVLRIRNEDRDSFAAYQFEIASLTDEALKGTLTDRDAQEAFQAKLLPKITKLKKELKTEANKATKFIGYGAVGLAASVAIGAFGLPLLGAIPLATVSTALLSSGTQKALSKDPDAKLNNDLYFLVRLLEETT